jgi:hypothetical protein
MMVRAKEEGRGAGRRKAIGREIPPPPLLPLPPFAFVIVAASKVGGWGKGAL